MQNRPPASTLPEGAETVFARACCCLVFSLFFWRLNCCRPGSVPVCVGASNILGNGLDGSQGLF